MKFITFFLNLIGIFPEFLSIFSNLLEFSGFYLKLLGFSLNFDEFIGAGNC